MWTAIGMVGATLLSSALADDQGAEGLNNASAQAARDQAALAKKQYAYWEGAYQPLEQDLVGDVTGYKWVDEQVPVQVQVPGRQSSNRKWVQTGTGAHGEAIGSYQQGTESSAPRTEMQTVRKLVQVGEPAGGPGDQEIAAGEANADVTQSFDRLKRENESRYARFGLTSPNAMSSAGSLALGEAATRGSAMTTARRGAKELGFQKRFNVSQLGRNIPSRAMSGLDSASGNLGRLGVNAGDRASQDQQNIAYGLAPLAKGIGNAAEDWYKKPKNNVTANQVSSGWTSEQAARYDGSGVASDNWFRDGGKIKRRRYAGGGRVIDGESTRYAESGLGGTVPGPEGAPPDSVDAKVTPGEVVLNPEAVEVLGEDVLHAANKIGLMRRYDAENSQRYADAGLEARQ